jgi:hypothetical protein
VFLQKLASSKIRTLQRFDRVPARMPNNGEAPHFCDASCVSMCFGGLIPYPEPSTFATQSQRRVAASRLERPGIKPGAGRGIRPPVDFIETPQRIFFPSLGTGRQEVVTVPRLRCATLGMTRCN